MSLALYHCRRTLFRVSSWGQKVFCQQYFLCGNKTPSSIQISFRPPSLSTNTRNCSTIDTSNSISELATFQPEIRKLRIVTHAELKEQEEAKRKREEELASSVERDTIYTRHHVDSDDPLVQELLQGIKEGKRVALAQAITLAESTHPMKKAQAQVLLKEVLEYTRLKQKHSIYKINSFRIGMYTYCSGQYLLE